MPLEMAFVMRTFEDSLSPHSRRIAAFADPTIRRDRNLVESWGTSIEQECDFFDSKEGLSLTVSSGEHGLLLLDLVFHSKMYPDLTPRLPAIIRRLLYLYLPDFASLTLLPLRP